MARDETNPTAAESSENNGAASVSPGNAWPTDWERSKLESHLEYIRNGLTKSPQNKDGRGYPVTRIETLANDTINIAKVGYIENVSDKDLRISDFNPAISFSVTLIVNRK